MVKEKSIPRAKSAESVGIDSSVINKMTEEMAYRGINIHSMMILRHSQVAMEGWSAPLTPEMPHMVYSVSKSFLSTAYGFALHEGLISRDTRVLDIIPEIRPKKKDDNLEKLTIHHLLTMTAGKQSSLKGVKGRDWLDSYVKAKWLFSPGEGWRYVNDNYFVASVMLTRVIGESITSYLTPRLYEPLGIDIPFWETSADGIEAGGWGLMLRTEDIAKFILCYHNKGMYDGKQVIPCQWVEEATSLITDNKDVDNHADSSAGYGCGFWRCAGMPDTYRCEGMFCQYGISFGQYDACLVMTCEHSDLQETLDVIWKFMPDAFIEPCEKSGTTEIALKDRTEVPVSPRSKTESLINGNTYKIRKCLFVNAIGFPVSVFPMPIVFFDHNISGNMNRIKFEFGENECRLSWQEDGDNYISVPLGMNGSAAMGNITVGQISIDVRSYCYWEREDTLCVCIRPLAAVAERVLKFTFNGNKIKMVPSSRPGTDEKAKKIGEKLKCILIGKWFHWWIDFLVPRVGNILNPTHHGKTTN